MIFLIKKFKEIIKLFILKAFPCWDEPHFKSTFEIIIVAERDKTVLSNMV
jgi:aminopeptidase N